MSIIYQPNTWRYAIAVVDNFFYYYVYCGSKLSTYPIKYLMGRHEDGKYMIKAENVYEIYHKTRKNGRKEGDTLGVLS